MSPTVVVVGSARSGTTVLRQFLGSAAQAFDLGEVFHGDTTLPYNFWGFAQRAAAADAGRRHPAALPALWQEFLEATRTELGFDVPIVDAKVEYFPYLLRVERDRVGFFFDDAASRYVVLERRNLLAQAASKALVAHTNVWSRVNIQSDLALRQRLALVRGKETPVAASGPLVVDPDALWREVDALAANRRWIRSLLDSHSPLYVEYDQLFDADGRFSEHMCRAAAGVTGLPAEAFSRQPVLLQQGSGRPLEAFANADEVRHRFRGTKYEVLLDDGVPDA